MEGGATFVYETLAPLAPSAEPPPPPLDPSEPYSVFRNEISASNSLSFPLPAADYFSLDLSADPSSTRKESPSLQTPNPTPPPPNEPSSSSSCFERAWFRSDGRFKSPMLKLHNEILDFCEFISPTQEEQAARAAAVQRVFGVVKYIWPHCNVEVFGSFKTGLYLPTSDIDVVILDSMVRTPQVGLQAVSRALSQRGIAKKMQVIGKARVPIVKFVEKESGVAFDVSFDVENGPKAAEFIKDAVARIPPLKPLCLILKIFLQQRELNEVYSGGIGSYALLAMLMAHLQMHWRRQDSKGGETSLEHNLGILLVKFFDFYGRKLNTCDVGVSCKSTGTLFLKSNKGFQKMERPYLLSIEDPQAPDNDIGKNSFNYFQIRSAFAMAYSMLTDAKAIIGLGPNQSILGIIIRPDRVLLERKGGCNGEVTFDSLLPGAGKPVQRQFVDDHDIQCNWHLFDDEPLPRGIVGVEDNSIQRPRKRGALKVKRKALANGDDVTDSQENRKKGKGIKQHRAGQDGDGSRKNWIPWHHHH
ncbi:hypothetical protein MRB53_035760 [Persea americana]|uniref:Uncharacterized protein n=1 Tax=Persea americana TaxID=3435 RepID=A0ACC2K5I4_PERAE|nr:hypothetical protein MRB53_035760 [Persea americana]